MEKAEIKAELKAVEKEIDTLIKKFTREAKRIKTLDDRANKKRDVLTTKGLNADGEKRRKLLDQRDALPDYEGPMQTIGSENDDFDESIIGALNAMSQDIHRVTQKDGFLDKYFEDLEIAEAPPDED